MKLTLLTFGLFVASGLARTLEKPTASTSDDDFFTIFINQEALKDENKTDPPPETPSSPSADYDAQEPLSKVARWSYEHKDGYDDEDDDHGGHQKGDYGYDAHGEDPYYATALFCRMAVYPFAKNPDECAEVKIKDYDSDFIYDDPHKTEAKGKCYWDLHLGKIDQQSGCLCPRSKGVCKKLKQCYWHVLPNPGKHEDDKKKSGYSYKSSKDDKGDDYGHCIHNSERFYNLLAKLLHKRGKKDLSLQIKYSSAPAKGKLPYGPYGPALIGGNAAHHHSYPQYHDNYLPYPQYHDNYLPYPQHHDNYLPYPQHHDNYLPHTQHHDNYIPHAQHYDNYFPHTQHYDNYVPQYQEYSGPPQENYYPEALDYHPNYPEYLYDQGPESFGYPDPQVYVTPQSYYGHREGHYTHQGYIADQGHYGCQQPHHVPYGYPPVIEHHPHQPYPYGQPETYYQPAPYIQPETYQPRPYAQSHSQSYN